ncbi:MAG: alginate lyase family protein [Planctomycetes bacterium]|nr:alginate lyase family protein [Planctomycetota bacterium]
MQSLRWYIQRLASMTPREVAWRAWGKVCGSLDRPLRRWRARDGSVGHILGVNPDESITASQVLGEHFRSGELKFNSAEARRWKPALIAQADRLVQHRIDLLSLQDLHLGDEIDWNYEYEAGKRIPLRAGASIDYRDYQEVGDCKLVWELSRHHHLVVLARAYRVTEKEQYAQEIARQLEGWIRQCPFGLGIHWRSPLELAIRMINWVWTYELLDGGARLPEPLRHQVLLSVHQHLSQITRQYSRFSSANNHLIGEAAGVFIAGSYFTGLKGSAKWRADSRKILVREIFRQTYLDGGTREQATAYHVFVLWFFILAGLCARRAGEDFPEEYWERMERMFDYLDTLTEGADALPQIGDGDDGYVVDLGGRADMLASLFSIGAMLFDRSDLKARAGPFGEAGFWLFGPAGRKQFDGLGTVETACPIQSRALPASGYYLLQRGHRGEADRISVVFDCGELGYLSIAAHGHADALSVLLRVGGLDVLVDPGTYDYFTYPQWRRYFRGTRAHNTVVVDDVDQSEMLGLFLWRHRARCQLLRWEPAERSGMVIGEHDGYVRLKDPVVHRRTVILPDDDLVQTASTVQAVLTVRDEILARGRHDVAVYWHFSEHCRVEQDGNSRFRVSFDTGFLTMTVDPCLSVEMVTGSEDPVLGWVSRGYHRKVPAMTLVGRCRSEGDLLLATRFEIVASEKQP